MHNWFALLWRFQVPTQFRCGKADELGHWAAEPRAACGGSSTATIGGGAMCPLAGVAIIPICIYTLYIWSIYIYIYVHIYICVCIYRERERERSGHTCIHKILVILVYIMDMRMPGGVYEWWLNTQVPAPQPVAYCCWAVGVPSDADLTWSHMV